MKFKALVILMCILFPINVYAIFDGYVAVWEEEQSEKEKKKDGWRQDYIFEYFANTKQAIEHLNWAHVENPPWEQGFIISSGIGSREKGKFIGLFRVGREVEIKKINEPVQYTKERWVLE